MKKITWFLFLLFACNTFSGLPILRTPLRKTGIDAVRLYAQQNNPEAQIELALRYYAGHQVPQDFQEALKWMTRAAGEGSADAQYLLSRMYAEGIGVDADRSKSEMWFAKAISNDPDNPELKQQYAEYLTGTDKNPDARTAFLKLCSDAGYTPAFADFWRPKAISLYSRNDYEGAQKIFQQLADRNDPEGMYYLAGMYAKGQGGLPEDDVEAFDLYHRSATNGFAPAQYELAAMYRQGTGTAQNPESAAAWYEKSANNGFTAARYELAESELSQAVFWKGRADSGDSDKKQQAEDLRKYNQKIFSAVEGYRKAAEEHDSCAQYMLGRLYASGEGVSVDYEQSIQCYRKSAAQDNAEALFHLGLMYQAGLGVPVDMNQALFCYEKAAELGSRAAVFYLGNCYRFGNGVAKNFRKGESIYLTKGLDGIDLESSCIPGIEPSELLKNIWVLRAAREYGVILWNRASSGQKLAEARRWVSLAARAGDSMARKILLQMVSGDQGKAGEPPSLIAETPVDSRADAIAPKRDISFFYPCLQADIPKIYAKARTGQIISQISIQEGRAQNAVGDSLWEFSIKYKRPSAHVAVGFNGVLLMGVEFENTETREKYWAFNESPDSQTPRVEDSDTNVSLFIDLNRYSHLRVSNWVVVYGHRFDDNLTFVVLDERRKSATEGNLEQVAFKDQYCQKLESTVVSTEDISGIIQSAQPSSDTSKSDSTSDSSSTLDSILSTIGIGN